MYTILVQYLVRIWLKFEAFFTSQKKYKQNKTI